ncbi:MAG: DUF6524 family protein [Steroidobacteraceae bacterium]|jgi:hypothetical protein|nr:DUF6524 family protein [Steroidobacteraceae bacterium]
MSQESIGFSGILLRFLAAFALVFLSFNPTGWSYFHWASRAVPQGISPPVVLAGIALVIAWGVFVRATARSIGFVGALLWGALFAALVWTAVWYGWLSLENRGALTWIGLVVVAAILALGMSWSHLRRQMTGQADVDEVTER